MDSTIIIMYWIIGTRLNLRVASMISTVAGDVTFVFTTESVGHSVMSLLPVNTKIHYTSE